MEIKILGMGCSKCKRLEALAREVATQAGVEAQFTKVEDMEAIMAYDVISTPALVIDEEVMASGRIPRKEEIAEWIRTAQSLEAPGETRQREKMRRKRTMLQIKVFGTTPPCANCKRAKAQAEKAAERFPDQVEVIELDALGPEAEQYGLVTTPLIVIGEEIVSKGQVVRADRLASIIGTKLGG